MAMIERGIPAAVREHFRHTLRRRREELGLRQKQMSDKFGITVGMYSHWETGFRFPTDDMLPRIAEELGLKVEQLVGEPVRLPTRDVLVAGTIPAGKVRNAQPDSVTISGRESESIEITWGMYYDFAGSEKLSMVALRVEGEAMAPHYRRGDMLFLERTAALPELEQTLVIELPKQGLAMKVLIAGDGEQYLASLTPNVFPIPVPKRPKVWGVVRGMMGRR